MHQLISKSKRGGLISLLVTPLYSPLSSSFLEHDCSINRHKALPFVGKKNKAREKKKEKKVIHMPMGKKTFYAKKESIATTVNKKIVAFPRTIC